MPNIREIPETAGIYGACDQGNIYRLVKYNNSKDAALKPSVVAGYLSVSICINNKSKRMLVHRLVCSAFHGLPDGMCVNHKNGNKFDNRPENLEACTHTENNRHMVDVLRKWNRLLTKLTTEQVIEIRRLKEKGLSLSQIAKMYGVTKSNISCICRGVTWRFVGEEPLPPPARRA